nr:probable F-box protein At5g04010 [Coffea arabica]
MSEKSLKSSPPWSVLSLVANHLDPKTLIIASCVCKSWSICMSSDHLWKPICSTLYPSLCNLRAANLAVPYRRLYNLGCVSEKLRLQKPLKPHLSLDSIIFAIDVFNGNVCLSTTIKPGNQLVVDKSFLFHFDIDADLGNGHGDPSVAIEALDSLRVTWNVVLGGLRSVFTMMDCKGKGSFVLGQEGWFSKELPQSGCCSSGDASGLVADLRLGLRQSGGKGMVERISVGVLSILSWRYVCIDDALRYLQHFLLPC